MTLDSSAPIVASTAAAPLAPLVISVPVTTPAPQPAEVEAAIPTSEVSTPPAQNTVIAPPTADTPTVTAEPRQPSPWVEVSTPLLVPFSTKKTSPVLAKPTFCLPPVGLFVLTQHGSHSANHRLDNLRQEIQATLEATFAKVDATPDSNTASSTAPDAAAAASPPSVPAAPRAVMKNVFLKVWGSDVNDRLKTDAGTRVCAQRLMAELVPELRLMAAEVARRRQIWINEQLTSEDADPAAVEATLTMPTVLFSCVGHSFGGIILRDLIALLREGQYWESQLDIHHQVQEQLDALNRTRLENPSAPPPPMPRTIRVKHSETSVSPFVGENPQFKFVTFATLATPHCGVVDLNPVMLFFGGLWAATASQTYSELLLRPSTPFLMQTLIDEVHLKALESFHRRLLCGSMALDHLVGIETSTLKYEGFTAEESAWVLPDPEPKSTVLTSVAASPVVDSASTSEVLTVATVESRHCLRDDCIVPAHYKHRNIGHPMEVPAWGGDTVPITVNNSDNGATPTQSTSLVFPRATFDVNNTHRFIAATLRQRLNFTLLPVKPAYWCAAHNAIAGQPALIPLRDVLAGVGKVIADDFIAVLTNQALPHYGQVVSAPNSKAIVPSVTVSSIPALTMGLRNVLSNSIAAITPKQGAVASPQGAARPASAPPALEEPRALSMVESFTVAPAEPPVPAPLPETTAAPGMVNAEDPITLPLSAASSP